MSTCCDRKRKKVRKWARSTSSPRSAYADLELDAKVELPRPGPVGLAACAGVARPGSDAGRRALRPERRVGRGAPHVQQPWDGGLAGQRCADSCAPPSPHRGERDPVAVLRGDACAIVMWTTWLRRVLYGISCRNYEAVRRGDSRGDRAFDRRCRARGRIQASAAPAAGVPGVGPVRRGRGGRVPGRQDVRRRDDGHRAGHHRLRATLREREGVTPFLRSLVERPDLSQGVLK